jgi:hypothetical protein
MQDLGTGCARVEIRDHREDKPRDLGEQEGPLLAARRAALKPATRKGSEVLVATFGV